MNKIPNLKLQRGPQLPSNRKKWKIVHNIHNKQIKKYFTQAQITFWTALTQTKTLTQLLQIQMKQKQYLGVDMGALNL